MLYSNHITVAASTTEANRVRTQFKINRGVIHRIWATFPPGCADLVNFRILHDEHPIIPSLKHQYVTGNNYTYVYHPFVPITVEPALITIETWSDDDTYSHKLHFQVSVISKIWLIPAGAVMGITASLKALFDRSRSS